MYLCIYVSMYLCIYVSMYLCIYDSMYLLSTCLSVCLSIYLSLSLLFICTDLYVFADMLSTRRISAMCAATDPTPAVAERRTVTNTAFLLFSVLCISCAPSSSSALNLSRYLPLPSPTLFRFHSQLPHADTRVAVGARPVEACGERVAVGATHCSLSEARIDA